MAVIAQSARSPRTRPNSRRRKVLAVFLVLLVGLGVASGVYAWRMVNAIVHAEKTAVYPLPPRNDQVAVQVSPTATPATSATTESVDGMAEPTATAANVNGSDSPAEVTPTASYAALPTGDDPSGSASCRI